MIVFINYLFRIDDIYRLFIKQNLTIGTVADGSRKNPQYSRYV
ncbi:hypothetical protein XBO1_2480014 [Xenorhabdus bovienii str. oregonense]|uniref:Uncharacterized protein n=1 Tax=Xenorhabdus bovienii str. oregonense TaxID=1398202 RepID=A0A077NXE6_XENBV|nr:hypothetical protein XBO1_2480014 [Xenorhabdus bovienii str. oregonense]